MIPFIRSLSELMAITGSRERISFLNQRDERDTKIKNSEPGKRYEQALDKKKVKLPEIPKKIRRKWIQNKVNLSRFIDELDYNNQIQSSYDLTLLEGQNKRNQQDVA